MLNHLAKLAHSSTSVFRFHPHLNFLVVPSASPRTSPLKLPTSQRRNLCICQRRNYYKYYKYYPFVSFTYLYTSIPIPKLISFNLFTLSLLSFPIIPLSAVFHFPIRSDRFNLSQTKFLTQFSTREYTITLGPGFVGAIESSILIYYLLTKHTDTQP